MNKYQSDIKAKLEAAIQRAGRDGMEYMMDRISKGEYHIRQQILADMLYVAIAGAEPKHEQEGV